MHTDIVIVGCGVAGLYCALNLPTEKKITIITKEDAPKSDSFLAQGGICVLRDEEDYPSFFEDTMKAGHYENNPASVEIMIRSSREVINELLSFGVRFETDGDALRYTREGAHSRPRILFHEDETGKEITSHLLEAVKRRKNVTLIEHFTMVDLICRENTCAGIIGHDANGNYRAIHADYTVLATGGIGGLFKHSTNYRHLTGDALALALKHGVALQHIDYIQIHPTTLYTQKPGREFLISESVRGEGAVLLNAKGERFVNELLPRDVVTKAIFEEMKKKAASTSGSPLPLSPRTRSKPISRTSISTVLRRATTSPKSPSPSYRHSITLWAASTWMPTARRPWTACTRWAKRRATAYTAAIGWRAIRCSKVWCLPNEPPHTLPPGTHRWNNPMKWSWMPKRTTIIPKRIKNWF